MVFGEFLGGSLPVEIGNNVFMGINCTILMGTKTGNNCIVGSGAVVSRTYPDNVVIAGNPAKIVCTLEEFYLKRKSKWVDSAKRCAIEIYKYSGRKPKLQEMSGFIWIFLPHTEEILKKYPGWFHLQADDYESVREDYLKSKPIYNSFEEFLEDCNLN